MIDTNKTYQTNSCGTLKIIRYKNSTNVLVEFCVTGFRTTVAADRITRGTVKDYLHPTVYGKGYVGEGLYLPSINRNHTKQYSTWKGMLGRCYSEKKLIERPTYQGCSVSDEWLNFQVFAKWFDENYIEGFELDKDCIFKGNKVYNPQTCMFVSQLTNLQQAHSKHFIFLRPNKEIVKIYNLAEFCRNNDLTNGLMTLVHRGEAAHHKQWTKYYPKQEGNKCLP